VPAATRRRKSTVNRFGRFFWRVLDALDYRVMDARLRILDAVCGPEPETPADRQRAREGDRLERALGLSPAGRLNRREGEWFWLSRSDCPRYPEQNRNILPGNGRKARTW
jgi:hypothetical protein